MTQIKNTAPQDIYQLPFESNYGDGSYVDKSYSAADLTSYDHPKRYETEESSNLIPAGSQMMRETENYNAIKVSLTHRIQDA